MMGKKDLLVISTDLSHYPSREDAAMIDWKTLEMIKSLDIPSLEEHIDRTMSLGIRNEDTCACGLEAVEVLMSIAKKQGWEAEILRYGNSGDLPVGQKDRVVGYGAMVFYGRGETADKACLKDEAEIGHGLDASQKKILLELVRNTVEAYVRTSRVINARITDERLNRKQGAFVTIHKDGNLRGCIGQIEPSAEPLWKVVQAMAIEAAIGDSRFRPVTVSELESLDFEISVLSEPTRIFDWRDIKLGKQGVIVRKGNKGGVFLPQVAVETGWDLERFLEALCVEKAGIHPDSYKNDREVELYAFEAEVFGEAD